MVGDCDKAPAAGRNRYRYVDNPINRDTFIAELEHFLLPELP